jgi:small GTP-binding protein
MTNIENDYNCYDYRFKLSIVGDEFVGKTCLLHRLIYKNFKQYIEPTIGIDFDTITIDIDDKKTKLHIWDLGGQPRFKDIREYYLKNISGFILVFDLTNRKTFNNIINWMTKLKKHINSAYIIIIGNKKDDLKNREVNKMEAIMLAKEYHTYYIETSAKTGENILDPFICISTIIINNIIKPIINNEKELMKIVVKKGISINNKKPEKNYRYNICSISSLFENLNIL